MSTAHHTPITTGAAADADTINDPLGDLDQAIDDVKSYAYPNSLELSNARSPYATLKARLDDMTGGYSGGNIATLTNGTAAAGQKVVTVDSTTGFLAGAYVAYMLVGGAVEYNLVDTVTDPTHLLLTTNIGTGGIGDNVYIGLISTSEYQAANAIPHAGALTLPQAMQYANGGVFNILAYGASPGASAATNTAAIQAAINALAIEENISGDFSGTLLIPPGVFQIDGALIFQSLRGFRMIGAGHTSRLVWTATSPTVNMIEIADCRNSRISDLQISTSGTCNAAIKIYSTLAKGVPTHNLFQNIMMDIAGAKYGFQIGNAAPSYYSNNDFMEFDNCEIYNYSDSGVIFVNSSQAYNYLFNNCALLGDGVNSKYGIDCGDGESVPGFIFTGGGIGNNTQAGFRVGNVMGQPVLIQGIDEEGCNRFLVASAYSQVEIKQCRISCSGVNADKIMIISGGLTSSLTIDHCTIGDGTVGGTVALKVARMTYGDDANAQVGGRFVFTNNLLFSTLDGTTWDDWPFDNSGSGYILPTEMHGNLIKTDINSAVVKRLDYNSAAPGGVYPGTYAVTSRSGGARFIRSSHDAESIATFVSVLPYHSFTVICDHTVTFVDKSTAVTGDNLWLAGHADWTATVGSSISFYYDFDNDRFIEIGRSQY